jgi:hypothetical protein
MEEPLKGLVDARERLKSLEAAMFHRASTVEGLFLNLGSGKRVLNGFVNIDRYTPHPSVLKADIYKLPFKDGTADGLFSAHSLEHLPIRRAYLALKDWHRVMKSGATLILSMPDIDMIMATLLKRDLSTKSRRWFMYTLFGYQADMDCGDQVEDPPVDPGQFHTCGYSKATLLDEMRGIGYVVQEAANYEGYGTPGLYIVATK